MTKVAEAINTAMNRTTADSLSQFLTISAAIDQPVMVYGKPGTGKSEIIKATYDKLGYALLDRRASQMLPEDFAGIPIGDPEKRTTERCVPDIVVEARRLHESTGKPVVVFLDEVNLGSPGVLAGLYEAVLDRTCGGFPFPPGTRIAAAGNQDTDGANVTELPRPLCNRLAIVEYAGPTFDEWAGYAFDAGVHPLVVTALKVAPEFLHQKFNSEVERSPTPRAWMRVSKLMHELEKNPELPKSFRLLGVSSIVGDEAALKVESIMELAVKLFGFDEIVKSPDTVPGHPSLALSFLQAMMLAGKVQDAQQTKACFVYVERTARELLGVFTRRVTARAHKEPNGYAIISDADLLTRLQKSGAVIEAGRYLKQGA